jgi:UDP-N-acetylenolpyruvoylglucosamine reductase
MIFQKPKSKFQQGLIEQTGFKGKRFGDAGFIHKIKL